MIREEYKEIRDQYKTTKNALAEMIKGLQDKGGSTHDIGILELQLRELSAAKPSTVHGVQVCTACDIISLKYICRESDKYGKVFDRFQCEVCDSEDKKIRNYGSGIDNLK